MAAYGSLISRAYQVSTGEADMATYVEIEKWGVDLENLDQNLTGMGWWQQNGGWKGSDACNTLKGNKVD